MRHIAFVIRLKKPFERWDWQGSIFAAQANQATYLVSHLLAVFARFYSSSSALLMKGCGVFKGNAISKCCSKAAFC